VSQIKFLRGSMLWLTQATQHIDLSSSAYGYTYTVRFSVPV